MSQRGAFSKRWRFKRDENVSLRARSHKAILAHVLFQIVVTLLLKNCVLNYLPLKSSLCVVLMSIRLMEIPISRLCLGCTIAILTRDGMSAFQSRLLAKNILVYLKFVPSLLVSPFLFCF